MINTVLSGYPIISQSTTSYSLPGFTGSVQWNGNVKKFQVSTGASWVDIDNNIHYNVNSNFQEIIQWAEGKMKEEKEMKAMLDKHPALRDAKEKFDIVYALIKDQSA